MKIEDLKYDKSKVQKGIDKAMQEEKDLSTDNGWCEHGKYGDGGCGICSGLTDFYTKKLEDPEFEKQCEKDQLNSFNEKFKDYHKQFESMSDVYDFLNEYRRGDKKIDSREVSKIIVNGLLEDYADNRPELCQRIEDLINKVIPQNLPKAETHDSLLGKVLIEQVDFIHLMTQLDTMKILLREDNFREHTRASLERIVIALEKELEKYLSNAD